jgi:hypothetical protein
MEAKGRIGWEYGRERVAGDPLNSPISTAVYAATKTASTFVAASVTLRKTPSIQRTLRWTLFGAIALATVWCGHYRSISAFGADAHFSMGGLDISPPKGWRMQAVGPNDVLFENVSGSTWMLSARRFRNKIAAVSVDIYVQKVDSQKERVWGAGLVFCSHMANNRCDIFYTALLTSDDKLAYYDYKDDEWSGGNSVGFGPTDHRYNLRIFPDSQKEDQIHLVVNGNDLMTIGSYVIPEWIGVLLAAEPGAGGRMTISNFHVEEPGHAPRAAQAPAPVPELSAPEALHNGDAAYHRHDYAEAMRWDRKAADQGNAGAQSNVGWLYQNGLAVPQDYVEAMRWYRKAADQGFATAQDNIGALYANGWGVPKDYAEAMRWFRKAADQGYAGAQKHVGLLYENGLGVPRNLDQARMWMQKAAANGDEDAKKWLSQHE